MRQVAVIVSLLLFCALCKAQNADTIVQQLPMADSTAVERLSLPDSLSVTNKVLTINDSVSMMDSVPPADNMQATGDSIQVNGKQVATTDSVVSVPLYANFKPNSNTSLWLALAIPGAGQIYNRKYWKLPIVYGLGVGIGYAIAYTNRNYKDFRSAYQTYTSSQPDPNLYNSLIPQGYPESSYRDYFKSQMDTYRRQRDISIVAAVFAYALQVIDAFVDAQLSDFDISPDLSIKVAPEVQEVNHQHSVGVGAAVEF